MDPNCVFCSIIKGETTASVVYQDDLVIAFHDINPGAPIHILIVPITHIPSISHISEDQTRLVGHMFMVANRLAAAQRIVDTGYRLIINSGPDANQTVFHLHLHLLGGQAMRYPMG